MVHYVFVQHIDSNLHNFIEAYLCLERKPSFSFQCESYEVKLAPFRVQKDLTIFDCIESV